MNMSQCEKRERGEAEPTFPRGLLCVLFIVVIQCICFLSVGMAEEDLVQAWVLCQPDSWINIRGSASKDGSYEGMLISGDEIWTDGRSRNGYIHCENMTIEAGAGWVYEGYVVYSEPVAIDGYCRIISKGRVACRRTIDGTRRKWLKDGDMIFVYSASDEWALTDVGFVQCSYIDLLNIKDEIRGEGR